MVFKIKRDCMGVDELLRKTWTPSGHFLFFGMRSSLVFQRVIFYFEEWFFFLRFLMHFDLFLQLL